MEESVSLGALRRALAASEDAGAEVELLDPRLEDYGDNVRRLLEALARADAVIISTAAYHGTPAGVTRNALDFVQYPSKSERAYLDGRAIGLIATAGGDHAAERVVAPLSVAVPKAWQRSDDEGNVTDAHVGRLEKLGRLVVGLAQRLSPERRGTRSRITRPAPVGIAS